MLPPLEFEAIAFAPVTKNNIFLTSIFFSAKITVFLYLSINAFNSPLLSAASALLKLGILPNEVRDTPSPSTLSS